MVKKIIRFLSSGTLFGILLLNLAISLGIATFIENDFGTQAAQEQVYQAHWFEVLLCLVIVNLLGGIIQRKLYTRKKLGGLMLHLGFVFMLFGAGITRYFSFEGVMHIREGETSDCIRLIDGQMHTLDFQLELDEFRVEYYPGSQHPASYSSCVYVHDKGGQPFLHEIYMNHILKHKGYRFYQTSFDEDKKGTILTVNYDIWGTTTTYFGYGLLFLGIVLSMLSPSGRIWKNVFSASSFSLLIFMCLSNHTYGASPEQYNKQTVANFGEILIQTPQGRTEPMQTFCYGLLRKISYKNSFEGFSPTEVFLEMTINGGEWSDKPMIKVGNHALQDYLGVDGKYAAYSDFFENGKYILTETIEKIQKKPYTQRDKFDKAVIKVDERLNLCQAIYAQKLLKVIPLPSDSLMNWVSPQEARYISNQYPEDALFLVKVMPTIISELTQAKTTRDVTTANQLIEALKKYQRKHANYELPSPRSLKFESFYYRAHIFGHLFKFYTLIGVLFLCIVLSSIIRGRHLLRRINQLFGILICAGFMAHTLGLAIRCYLSGHAPMTNGYETMVFISWVTILCGLFYFRTSKVVTAATTSLGGFTLMVANLSFMDPQITSLVPVLKSNWLTLHVSTITTSYGFFALSMVLGLMSQILIICTTQTNKGRLHSTIVELSNINQRSMMFGLNLLTIGTFVGAIWANESWGRYWGWDPKETWSLITIIIYTIVTHIHLIPSFKKNIFGINVLSVCAFGSVLMTYFGVNYFLSGMHSYAGGDSIEIPIFVYVILGLLFILMLMSALKYRKIKQI